MMSRQVAYILLGSLANIWANVTNKLLNACSLNSLVYKKKKVYKIYRY